MAKTKKEQSNAPAFETRLNSIRVSVWKNENDDGAVWFNTTINRRYKDGDDWKSTDTYTSLSDLALVAEGVRLARDFIAAQELAMQQ